MKNKRFQSSFEGGSRRRSNLPIIPVALVVLVMALLALFWAQGGEKPQHRVEKVIPADKLGQ